MNKVWLSQCLNLGLWIPSGCTWVSSTSCCSLESARDCSRKTGLSGTPKWPIDGVKYGQTYGNRNRNWGSSNQKLQDKRGLMVDPSSSKKPENWIKLRCFSHLYRRLHHFNRSFVLPISTKLRLQQRLRKHLKSINVKGGFRFWRNSWIDEDRWGWHR